MTQDPAGTPDIQTLIQDELDKRGLSEFPAPPAQSVDFEDVLASLDPADSEAALAMLDYLLRTGRLNRLGVLDGGLGYLFAYSEPQGSTKEGYRPGATVGDQIVDQALDRQRASGATRAKRGLCPYCMTVVKDVDGTILVDDDDAVDPGLCVKSPDGAHGMAS